MSIFTYTRPLTLSPPLSSLALLTPFHLHLCLTCPANTPSSLPLPQHSPLALFSSPTRLFLLNAFPYAFPTPFPRPFPPAPSPTLLVHVPSPKPYAHSYSHDPPLTNTPISRSFASAPSLPHLHPPRHSSFPFFHLSLFSSPAPNPTRFFTSPLSCCSLHPVPNTTPHPWSFLPPCCYTSNPVPLASLSSTPLPAPLHYAPAPSTIPLPGPTTRQWGDNCITEVNRRLSMLMRSCLRLPCLRHSDLIRARLTLFVPRGPLS